MAICVFRDDDGMSSIIFLKIFLVKSLKILKICILDPSAEPALFRIGGTHSYSKYEIDFIYSF